MTDANCAANAAEELARAEECLKEARALHVAGLPFGVASRAYYAVFHAVRALLFSAGLEMKSHRGTLSLLGEHFVKPGRLTAELARTAAHMQRDREDADYATGTVFTDTQVAQMVSDAERFVAEARRLVGG
ncbi:MAG TPA: HEPN domain-containing protein [Polyangia bacterium]